MVYDASLEKRLRAAVPNTPDISDKAMFGGVAFLTDGKMFIGIVKDDLMVRVGPDAHDDALKKPHVRTMDFTGRPMKGYVFVAPAGTKTSAAIAPWVDASLAHVRTLEKKPTKPKKAAAKATKTAPPQKRVVRR